MSARSPRTRFAVAVVAATLGATVVMSPVLASTGHLPRPATKLNCALVSPAQLAKLSGLAVAKATAVVEGSTTTCTYQAKVGEVILQYVTGYSLAGYNANLVQFKLHSEKTMTLKGYGDHAVEITLGKLPAGIALIKGKTGFLVSAIVALPKLEAITKAVLPSL